MHTVNKTKNPINLQTHHEALGCKEFLSFLWNNDCFIPTSIAISCTCLSGCSCGRGPGWRFCIRTTGDKLKCAALTNTKADSVWEYGCTVLNICYKLQLLFHGWTFLQNQEALTFAVLLQVPVLRSCTLGLVLLAVLSWTFGGEGDNVKSSMDRSANPLIYTSNQITNLVTGSFCFVGFPNFNRTGGDSNDSLSLF